MKTSTLLFFGAFLAMFAFDYLFGYLPRKDFITSGTTSPYVKEILGNLENPIDATNSPVEERRFSVGYINRADLMPGIRLIHDPSLGKEIIAKGPEAALDVLSLSRQEGRLSPDFTKLVKLNELVEVRANLEAHGSDRMLIIFGYGRISAALPAEFTTAGPMNFRFLEFKNAGNKKIEVNTQNLVVFAGNPTDNFFGTADRLELMYYDGEVDTKTLPNLKSNEIIRTKYDNFARKLNRVFTPKKAEDSIITIDSLVIQD